MYQHHIVSARKLSHSMHWTAMLLAVALAGSAPARAEVSAADAKSGIVDCTDAVLNS
jgi:hypothetical protein